MTVGETIEWDASASFDEDGTIVAYEWDYGDAVVMSFGMSPMAASHKGHHQTTEPQSSYTYLKAGTYYVTLTVIDDMGATDTVQAEVQVQPLEVGVYISPRRLNLNSRGKWMTATIRVPSGFDARMIDPDSLYLVPAGRDRIPARSVYIPKWHRKCQKKKYRRARKLIARFSRQDLIAALDGTKGEITLGVTGTIATPKCSLAFSGDGTIKAYERKKKISFKQALLKLLMRLFSRG